MKTIVELINPSDAITFEMDDAMDNLAIAGVAIILLGQGAYGLEDMEGKTVVPLMLFGGVEKWLEARGIASMKFFVETNAEKIAAFLETICYGSAEEREAVEVACGRMTPEKAEEHRAWWNDKKRSSLNDIGKNALALANALRNKATGPLPSSKPIILSA